MPSNRDSANRNDAAPCEGFDYSTPEALDALRGVTELVLEMRREIDRKTVLYERTLGLAVAPVLVRRAAIILWRKARQWRQGIR